MRIPIVSDASDMLKSVANMGADGLDLTNEQLENLKLGLSQAAGDYQFETKMWEEIAKSLLLNGISGFSGLLHSYANSNILDSDIVNDMVLYTQKFINNIEQGIENIIDNVKDAFDGLEL